MLSLVEVVSPVDHCERGKADWKKKPASLITHVSKFRLQKHQFCKLVSFDIFKMNDKDEHHLLTTSILFACTDHNFFPQSIQLF